MFVLHFVQGFPSSFFFRRSPFLHVRLHSLRTLRSAVGRLPDHGPRMGPAKPNRFRNRKKTVLFSPPKFKKLKTSRDHRGSPHPPPWKNPQQSPRLSSRPRFFDTRSGHIFLFEVPAPLFPREFRHPPTTAPSPFSPSKAVFFFFVFLRIRRFPVSRIRQISPYCFFFCPLLFHRLGKPEDESPMRRGNRTPDECPITIVSSRGILSFSPVPKTRLSPAPVD